MHNVCANRFPKVRQRLRQSELSALFGLFYL
ncbi:hypothetical protein Thi970DRAFT_03117 [Thiorhodovibrio frisius]|uniref:Uncharacterized protein n=1 Tax=Thiorhodovibrio frisius TaxID=631362 RepID=H8Z5Q4_9GAMM|nr:hypothetical protein Thi970DRAFT_03117 [Thiorhodovibrio frisius]WPL20500.1 hypothetical protein Thiofri_00598 [Thiorhodovibrio frisius]